MIIRHSIITAFLFIFLFIVGNTHAVSAITGKVVSVSDGDTITILDSTRTQHKIRLWGIDCPEGGQDFGNKAKKFTSNLVFGKTVSITPEDTDRYGRTVGTVKIDGKSLNEELIIAGFAWVYIKYCNKPVCDQWKRYEEAARRGRVGLWVQSNAAPPWDFRRVEREGVPVEQKRVVLQSSGVYHGNTKSMVFHQSSCGAYNSKNCTEIFNTREAAIAAGYRPCGACKP
jgi:endonuclease YncB( thermonuclease family)